MDSCVRGLDPKFIADIYTNGPQVWLFWVQSRDTPDLIALGSFMSRVQASHPAARKST